jgi:hypothetical protein
MDKGVLYISPTYCISNLLYGTVGLKATKALTNSKTVSSGPPSGTLDV